MGESRRFHRRFERFGAQCACIVLLSAQWMLPVRSRAEAEPDAKWLVIPSVVATQGDPKHPARAAARLVAEELRAHGPRTFGTDEAKMLFEQQGSAPPMTASAADIDELARDAQRALYHVASGLPARAKQDVVRALERARGALESLNRETRAAQHLLDACLYLVRAQLRSGAREEAKRQALECRRLVPDIAPEPTIHPPDVIGVLAEAQAQLRAFEPVSLRIESEPMGCAAYVNGRNLGPTPRELSKLSPGEYRIQAECDQGVMGRVHRVALANNRVVLKVDTRYDRAIETLFDISLGYPSAADERRHLTPDSIETARIVGASDVVVASLATQDATGFAVRLDRYRVIDGVLLATTRLPLDLQLNASESALTAARKALEEPPAQLPERLPPHVSAAVPDGEGAAAIAPTPSASAAAPSESVISEPTREVAEPANAETPASESSVVPVVGYSLGIAGIATQAVGWVLYARLLGAQDTYADALNANRTPDMRTTPELNALRDIDSADDAPPIAVGAGALLTSISVPMWLPEAEGMPWWAWTSAAAGVGLAATGALLTVSASDCEVDRYDRCTNAALATDVGPLLLMQAAPFLAVPIVQLVREWTGGAAQASVELSHERAVLRIEGRL